MNTATTHPGPPQPVRQQLVQYVWVFLALAALGLAVFAIVDFGNTYGEEEWPYLYTVIDQGTPQYFDARPFRLLSVYLAANLLGPHPIGLHAVYLALRIASAFALYLLVREFSEADPLFAFACAGVYLTYLVRDDVFVRDVYMVMFSADVLLMTLALTFHFAYMSRGHPARLVLSVVMALVAILEYEVVLPILAVIPPAVFLARRDFSRQKIVGIAVWLAPVLLGSLRIGLPLLGLAPATYASSVVTGDGVPLGTMVSNLAIQLRRAFLDPLVLERPSLRDYKLGLLLAAAINVLTLAAVRRVLPWPEGGTATPIRTYGLWLAVGLAATMLGIAPFVPTLFGAQIGRVHVIPGIAEAIAIAAFIWLVSHLVRNAEYRRLIQIAVLVAVTVHGAAQSGRLQSEMQDLGAGATWDTQAAYLRSLVNLVPSVEDHTLFIYVENLEEPLEDAVFEEQVPFVRAWSFEYAMRYLYGGDTMGLGSFEFPDAFFHPLDVSDAGIEVVPFDSVADHPSSRHAFYGWDEVIAVGKDERGRALILDELPGDLSTPARAAVYNPYDRIHTAYVPERTQRLLPPILLLP